MRRTIAVASLSFLAGTQALACDTSLECDLHVDDLSSFENIRAASLGGAYTTIAEGSSAALYNPAGIGGIHWHKTKPPFVRELYFPRILVDANKSAASNISKGDAAMDAAAKSGRVYLRASSVVDVVFSRVMLVAFNDQQVAGRKTDELADAEEVEFAYRGRSGAGLGFSITTPKEKFYIGAYAEAALAQANRGQARFADMLNPEVALSTLGSGASSGIEVNTHFGSSWIIGKEALPTLSLVARNLKPISQVTGGSAETQPRALDVALAFALFPQLSKRNFLGFTFDINHFNSATLSLGHRLRFGAELMLGGFGERAIFSLRTGYNIAGFSGGFGLNLGLLKLAVATHAVNRGIENQVIPEQRFLASIAVNVLDE